MQTIVKTPVDYCNSSHIIVIGTGPHFYWEDCGDQMFGPCMAITMSFGPRGQDIAARSRFGPRTDYGYQIWSTFAKYWQSWMKCNLIPSPSYRQFVLQPWRKGEGEFEAAQLPLAFSPQLRDTAPVPSPSHPMQSSHSHGEKARGKL